MILAQMYAEWCSAKDAETAAREHRRLMEDMIIAAVGENPANPGTRKYADGGYSAAIICRTLRRVDPEILMQVSGKIDKDILDDLMTVRIEIPQHKWATADELVKRALAPAVTELPARPTFKISPKGQ